MRHLAAAIVTATICVCSLVADISDSTTHDDRDSWSVTVTLALILFACLITWGRDDK